MANSIESGLHHAARSGQRIADDADRYNVRRRRVISGWPRRARRGHVVPGPGRQREQRQGAARECKCAAALFI